MKKFLFSISTLVLVLAGCRSPEPEPFASFVVSAHKVQVFENVDFTNTSSDIPGICEWDFGDGTFVTALHATHYYENAGVYTVTLRLYDHSVLVSQASASIEVVTTGLTVIVKEYDTEHRISNAHVTLYPTQDDWYYMTNQIVEGTTDNDGIVIFENLDPVIYFVDVWHENYDNNQLALEDLQWIMTDQLVPDEMSDFVAYVDYTGVTKRMEGKNIASIQLKGTERRIRYNVK
jgi:PKD repeat protein